MLPIKELLLVSFLALAFGQAQETGGGTGGAETGGAQASAQGVSGVVYSDLNENRQRDEGEPGVVGVSVSNGLEVVQTGADGSYELPVRDEMILFVSKPVDYMVPVDDNGVPQFSYVHQPKGSPDFIQEYAGLEPTGPLPELVDFPLLPTEEHNAFRFIVLGDLQPYTPEEVSWVRDTAIAELTDSDALFGVAVGDLVGDALDLYPRLQEVMGELPFPTYYLPGNHDLNFDSPNDRYSLESYKRSFGAPYYSFDYGQVHFVSLDNLVWQDEGYEDSYNGRLTDQQLQWLQNDLQYVDPNKLIVLAMHVGLTNYVDRDSFKHQESNRERVYQLLERGGFENVISLGGHSHTLERMRPGESYNPGTVTDDEGETVESFGWGTVPFPQYVVGAVAGQWWSGPRNEFGIPTSYARDGTPRGYMVFEVDGNEYSEHFKVTGSDATMHITFVTGGVDNAQQVAQQGMMNVGQAGNAVVLANVYAGSRDTEVTMQVDDHQPVPMQWNKERQDPLPVAYAEGEEKPTYPGSSPHLYSAPLPENLAPGAHTVTVRAVDPYGQEWVYRRVVEVIGGAQAAAKR